MKLKLSSFQAAKLQIIPDVIGAVSYVDAFLAFEGHKILICSGSTKAQSVH